MLEFLELIPMSVAALIAVGLLPYAVWAICRTIVYYKPADEPLHRLIAHMRRPR